MTTSWVNLPIEKIAEQLAEQAVVGRKLRTLKQADWKAQIGDLLGRAGKTISENPTAAGGLIGGGLGAAYGALRERSEPEEDRNTLGASLTGGLAGAAAGAGGGALLSAWRAARNDPSAAVGRTGNVFTHKGRDYKLKPGANIDPSVLTQKPSPFLNFRDYPIVSSIAGLDLANLTAGSLAEKINPGGSINVNALRQGARNALQPAKDTQGLLGPLKGDKGVGKNLAKLLRLDDDSLQKLLLDAKQGVGVSTAAGKPTSLTPELLQRLTSSGSSKIRGLDTGDISGLLGKGRKLLEDVLPTSITSKFGKQPPGTYGTGFKPNGAAAAGTGNKILRAATKYGPKPTSSSSTLARLGPRALLYGLYPALSSFGSEGMSNSAIKQILSQHAEPVK